MEEEVGLISNTPYSPETTYPSLSYSASSKFLVVPEATVV